MQDISSFVIDHNANNKEKDTTKNKEKLQAKTEKALYRSLCFISKQIIPELQAHKNRPLSKSPTDIQKQIEDVIQTYTLTRPKFKQDDVMAYRIFIPTPEATDNNNTTPKSDSLSPSSNTNEITLQQNAQ